MENTEWYWDLRRNRAVPAHERGPGEDVLGPYPTRFEAEHWRDRVEQRNDEWDEADERWEHAGESDAEADAEANAAAGTETATEATGDDSSPPGASAPTG